MFVPLSNIPITLWATMSFRAVATFDEPLFQLTVEPIASRTRGAEFVEAITVLTGLIRVRYRLFEEIDLSERIPIAGLEFESTGPVDPFVIITPSIVPDTQDVKSLFDQLIVAAAPPPPQGSDPRSLVYNVALYRAVPVSNQIG